MTFVGFKFSDDSPTRGARNQLVTNSTLEGKECVQVGINPATRFYRNETVFKHRATNLSFSALRFLSSAAEKKTPWQKECHWICATMPFVTVQLTIFRTVGCNIHDKCSQVFSYSRFNTTGEIKLFISKLYYFKIFPNVEFFWTLPSAKLISLSIWFKFLKVP